MVSLQLNSKQYAYLYFKYQALITYKALGFLNQPESQT